MLYSVSVLRPHPILLPAFEHIHNKCTHLNSFIHLFIDLRNARMNRFIHIRYFETKTKKHTFTHIYVLAIVYQSLYGKFRYSINNWSCPSRLYLYGLLSIIYICLLCNRNTNVRVQSLHSFSFIHFARFQMTHA